MGVDLLTLPAHDIASVVCTSAREDLDVICDGTYHEIGQAPGQGDDTVPYRVL